MKVKQRKNGQLFRGGYTGNVTSKRDCTTAPGYNQRDVRYQIPATRYIEKEIQAVGYFLDVDTPDALKDVLTDNDQESKYRGMNPLDAMRRFSKSGYDLRVLLKKRNLEPVFESLVNTKKRKHTEYMNVGIMSPIDMDNEVSAVMITCDWSTVEKHLDNENFDKLLYDLNLPKPPFINENEMKFVDSHVASVIKYVTSWRNSQRQKINRRACELLGDYLGDGWDGEESQNFLETETVMKDLAKFEEELREELIKESDILKKLTEPTPEYYRKPKKWYQK